MELYEFLRNHCLTFNGTFEDYPFGAETTVMKVRATSTSAEKMFALLWFSPDELRINLKCEPVLAEQLRATYPHITPGYHMNKRHWNSITLPSGWQPEDDGLQLHHVLDLIEDSYDLVVSQLPRTDRALLGWTTQ
ncbi:MmcQ/YjbR family DNA-binding protein [Timonella sp. A28]|uniref:MmcQ/YjbR family DNA-binding protein n=1 Tax=Timonella sp. A28 TaxID=3442640 RepID=UPI003EC0DDCE